MDVANWQPIIRLHPLSARVLCVARTRIEGTWAAYVDAVPGQRHSVEWEPVLDTGAKLDEPLARVLFPEFTDRPYAP